MNTHTPCDADPEVPASAPSTTTSGGSTLAALGAVAAAAALTACGGGDDTDATGDGRAHAMATTATPTKLDAWRFLTQATMGPKAGDIDAVIQQGYSTWLNNQFKQARQQTYAEYYNISAGQLPYTFRADLKDKDHPNGTILPGEWDRHMTFALWQKPLVEADQLRHRVTYALSQILVVSLQDDIVGFRAYLAAGYMDLLANHAFGNFRTLIRAVATSPAMGYYLSHMANRPPIPGKHIPDQNFARELLQLFTIGLTELNMDGTEVTTGTPARPIPTTTTKDIVVLSNVFTGWSLDNRADYNVSGVMAYSDVAPYYTIVEDKMNWYDDTPKTRRSPRYINPMKGYTTFVTPIGTETVHSSNEELAAQLGTTKDKITLLGSPFALCDTPDQSLDAALKIIFEHKNLAPFIAKQMIQRLVTSNPTGSYVQRVATAFQASNWDMRTLISSILLDNEARVASLATINTYGKLREPYLRVMALMRAFNVTGCFPGETNFISLDRPELNLNHAPLRSPSVFNDFSPRYQHAGGAMAGKGKVTPEMQIATESSVIAYINAVYTIIDKGLSQGNDSTLTGILDLTPLENVATTPSALVEVINTRLFGGAMSAELKSLLTTAATGTDNNQNKKERAKAALLMAAVSTEFMVQR